MVSRLRWIASLLALLAGVAGAQDADLAASVDRSTIGENESFTYVLRAEGRIAGEPDVSALERDFDILNRSTSARIQTINGRTEQVAEYIYQLMPRAPGQYTLPPIALDGRLSNSVALEVTPVENTADAPADIFMEVEANPGVAYVQAQVVYTLRLFVGVGIGRATLTQPQVSGGEAIVERLGEDSQYQIVRGNRSFTVRERRYAIFPQQAGTLTIGPSSFEAMVIPNRGFSRVQRLRSDSLSVEVKPAVAPPASHPDAVWLPARQLTLTENWADTEQSFRLGVPRTRVLSVVADGLLETQLPELQVGAAEGVRQYPDQPELERQVADTGLEATRTQRYAVIAQAVGEATIPAAELPWWNVLEERWEVARLDAVVVPVVPGTDAAPVDPAITAPATPDPALAPTAGIWPWVAAGMGLGWLLTALGWARSRRVPTVGDGPAAGPSVKPRASRRSLVRQLRAACTVNDAGRVQQLLLDWGRTLNPDKPPPSLGVLADGLDSELAGEIRALESHLYGRGSADWQGARLAALISAVDPKKAAGRATGAEPLDPLYR